MISQLWGILRQRRAFLNGTVLEYVLVGLLFALLTAFYTDWVVLHITKQIFIERVGDGTAGFLWLNYADKDWNPLLGFTTLVNYPTGAPLGGSSFIVYSALWMPLWFLAHIVGPVAALNLVTFWGFFSGALSTYWLVKRLFSSPPIGVLAGFAVAFVPYHIIKSSSHLAYIFSVVFVLLVAAFIAVWRRPTFKRALLLAAALGLAFYTDGYYILLSMVLLTMLCAGGVIFGSFVRYSRQDYLVRLKYFGIAAGAFLVICAPLAYTQLSANSEVSSELSNARKPISSEIPYYAAKRVDFMTPPLQNPFFKDISKYQDLQVQKSNHSNYSENTLYVGYVLLALCAYGCVALTIIVFRRNKSTFGLDSDQRRRVVLLAILFLLPLPVLLLFMVPPYKELLGHHIVMPSGFLVDHNISLWRVMTRFFVPFHLLIVLFSALSLYLLNKNLARKIRAVKWRRIIEWLIAIVLILVLAVEYATTINRPPFSIDHIPKAYTWLNNQKDIKVIAELPLLDRPFSVSYRYVAAQLVHNKRLVNSHLTNQALGSRNALGGPENTDAVDFAVARGAQAIVVHADSCRAYTWGSLSYQGPGWAERDTGMSETKRICIYTDLRPATSDRLFAHILSGMAPEDAKVYGARLYNMFNDGNIRLGVYDENDKKVTKEYKATLRTYVTVTRSLTEAPFEGKWKVMQGGRTVAADSFAVEDSLHTAPITATIDSSKDIQIKITSTSGKAPDPYTLSLTSILVERQ